jgi:hypothetical protein
MRALRNTFIFLVTLSLTAAGIGIFAPKPRVAIVTPKLTWLAGHADDFDVLFLGSSRTYRQVIPELFDQLMADAGKPVRSFNLGIDGMRPPEDTYVLEEVLKHRSKPLQWVFVECNPLRLTMRDEDQDTVRAVYWHDWKRFATLFRRAFLADEKKRNWRDRTKEIAKACPDFFDHTGYWLQNMTHIGQGHAAIENWLFKGGMPPVAMHDVGPRRDGYKVSDAPEQMNAEQLAAYQEELAEMKLNPPRADYADRVSQEELEEKQRIVERAGGKLALLIPPFTASKYFNPKPSENGPLLLDFSSPAKFPELFAPEHHSDSGHVNRVGAELYTRQIVRALLERL